MRHFTSCLFTALALAAVADPCTSIEPITCGTTVTFATNDHGDPDYPNGFHHAGWYGLSGQGGPERIYRFTVPADGTYQINVVQTLGINSAEFFWKNDTLGCGPSDWNFIGFTNFDDFPLAGIQWNAGDEILLLVNQEGYEAESVTFALVCLPPVCSAITPITCGQQVGRTTYGYGDPVYANGLAHPGWYATAGQGGAEQLYRFGVPADGSYHLVVMDATAFRPVGFFWKSEDLGCGPADWNFIGFTDQSGHVFTDVELTGGDTILVLLNAESREVATTTFAMDCLGMGITASPVLSSLRIRPQPAQGNVTFEGWKGRQQVRILSDAGAEVRRYAGTAPLEVDPHLPAGHYIVEVAGRYRTHFVVVP